MSLMDDETVRMFVEESREHLSSIENDLLIMEEGGADIDVELVNKVFRAAHSLKGGAGFLNLGQIKELAHKMENVLDLVRSRELVPNPEVINILLLAFDRLREMINNVDESNQTDISEFITALTGLTKSGLPVEQQESVNTLVEIKIPGGEAVLQITAFDLAQARKGGNYVYAVEFDLIHDVQRIGKTPFAIIKNMVETGKLLDCLIDLTTMGTLEDEPSNRFPMYVLFATIIDPDIIGSVLEVDSAKIHLIPEGQETAGKKEAAVPPAAKPVKPAEVPRPVKQAPQASPPPPPPPPAPASKPDAGQEPAPSRDSQAAQAAAVQSDTSLRVNVHLLETLMNLAGELVLGRNQLLQAIALNEPRATKIAGQRINMVTSELQEAIMLTRMQPIGNIFNKFPRVVRDLAKNVGKEINLNLLGKDVEMDKTIIEGLSDPLTHLVRNAVDHGVEVPDERLRAGKSAAGTVTLKAYHEAGQVIVEISDDGKGIDPQKIASVAVTKGIITAEQVKTMSDREKMALILLPGFSTAEKVTEISGRGVGMDVVKTNLDRLGGQVEIQSEIGSGSIFRIKLPLTLAILPSLFVSVSGIRFAIPQASVEELIRISASQVKERIERVGDAEVLILRGKMIPIVRLDDILGIEHTYADPNSGLRKSDRRGQHVERRSRSQSDALQPDLESRKDNDRRYRAASDLNIVIVTIGTFSYGLIVEELHDSIEIVIKPLGRHLKQLREYAGATIMGDGKVALILDINGISTLAGLTSMAGTTRAKELAEEAARDRFQDIQSFLLFKNSPEEYCAVPLDLVERIEQIKPSAIEAVSGKKVMQYRGESMPLFTLHEVALDVTALSEQSQYIIIVFTIADRSIGLLGIPPVDVIEVKANIDRTTLRQPGIMGSAIINGHTTLVVDIHEFVETLKPEWFSERKKTLPAAEASVKILLAEDSDFFRNQMKKFIEEEGFSILAAEDGQKAWELLQDYEGEVQLVVTDIEMPNMDGYGLTRLIRADSRFDRLPIIAVTSLAGDEDMARGREAGIDDYQIKLDKEKLLSAIHDYIRRRTST